MRFVIKSAIAGVAVWIATLLPLDLVLEGGGDEWWERPLVFLAVGALIVLLNAILKPILKFVSFPILILTLGLFSFVIAWFILWLTAWITEEFVGFATLSVGGFWSTLGAALVIAIATAIMEAVIPGAKKDDRRRRR